LAGVYTDQMPNCPICISPDFLPFHIKRQNLARGMSHKFSF
jgi:hypothetical protein